MSSSKEFERDTCSRVIDFLPTASLRNLEVRSQLLTKLRAFFATHGFLEVDTPLLCRDSVIDRYLDPIKVTLDRPSNQACDFWLQTSPEFGMKRLLAAGMKSIYQVTRAFRADEEGQHHNPEFTIAEWYQVGDDYEAGMNVVSELCQFILGSQPAERESYQSLFYQHTGLDPLECTSEQMCRLAAQRGLFVSPSMRTADRDSWLNLLLTSLVEPNLGISKPLIVYDFPASQAALARVCQNDSRVASRFELYVNGIELANGYHELLDAGELADRNRATNKLRRADGKCAINEDSYLLEAMKHGLPECTGVALGFDRLVMVAVGAETISDVMPFPISNA